MDICESIPASLREQAGTELGVPLRSLPERSQQLARRMFRYYYIDGPAQSLRLKSLNLSERATLSASGTSYNSGYVVVDRDATFSYRGNSVTIVRSGQRGARERTVSVTQRRTAKTLADFVTAVESSSRVRCAPEPALQKKPMVYAGIERASGDALLRAAARLFTLKLTPSQTDPWRLTRPRVAPPREVTEVYRVIPRMLPAALYRCLVQSRTAANRSFDTGDAGNAQAMNRRTQAILSNMNAFAERMIAESLKSTPRPLAFHQADDFIRSTYAVNQMYEFLGRLSRLDTGAPPLYFTQFERLQVRVTEANGMRTLYFVLPQADGRAFEVTGAHFRPERISEGVKRP